ncbi:MAG: glycosyltransferase family 4 protein [Candidatus Neomarinimicrobiota bacterium]
MKILLLSRYDRKGGSSRVRFYQYLPYLARQGVEVKPAPLLNDDYVNRFYAGQSKNWGSIIQAYWRRIAVLLKSHSYDLLWIQGELFPSLPAWGERALRLLKIPYVVDYDDAIFHRYDQHASRVVRLMLGKKIDRVMRGATLVIAGNNYLAERAKKAGAERIEYLPSIIDIERYEVRSKPKEQTLEIGWIGTQATVHYLAAIYQALSDIHSMGGVTITLLGPRDAPLEGMPYRILPWSEDKEVSEIKKFDVGIMPLPDEPWERGKCGFKLIQYMACGLPVVGSPVGVNRDIIEQSVNGFAAETHEEWVRALVRLKEDPQLRHMMGQNGRKKVEEHYSLQVSAPRLAELLHSASEAQIALRH